MRTSNSVIFDTYERHARLYPALILTWQPIIVGTAIYGPYLSRLEYLVPATCALILPTLLASFARESGRRVEPILYEQWGVRPTEALLGQHDVSLDPHTKARYYSKLSEATGVPPPAQGENSTDVFSAWTTYLKTKTRDREKFPLLYAENVSYGFRRNLYGLKRYGIAVACFAGLLTSFHMRSLPFGDVLKELNLTIALGICLASLAFWCLFVTREWVRTQAFSYAARLLETIDSLSE